MYKLFFELFLSCQRRLASSLHANSLDSSFRWNDEKTILLLAVFIFGSALASSTMEDSYKEVKLVANDTSAKVQDERLINPWGLTFNMNGDLIVAINNNTSVIATSYKQDGSIRNFSIPNTGDYHPTGIEINDCEDDFLICVDEEKAARFLFATEQGQILAFNKEVSENPILVIDRSSNASSYKGLALGFDSQDDHQFIFAADFHNGLIDVFDHEFNYVKSFTDTDIPDGFAPFNIQNFHGKLYVTYAKKKTDSDDDEPGPGNGYVDVFETDGTLCERLISQGQLNSPWGLAIAPHDFGCFSDALLVGNHGDGLINAYDLDTGEFLGTISDEKNVPIKIDGLWAIEFFEDSCKLFFTSGPNSEAGGLVGYIKPD